MANRKISWDIVASKEFEQGINYIAGNSVQNAEKVRQEIVNRIEQLLGNPERHAPDKYKINNDGSYRAFELHKYRISYFIATDEIRILQIRHTSREPKPY